MNTTLTTIISATLVVLTSVANAAIQGPTYPAPGGNSFSGNGVSGANGTAIWNYSGFDTNGFDSLYFGLNQTDHGALGAGLDGVANPFSLHAISGNTAEWRANTSWFVSTGGPHVPATTRLVMTVTGLGATPWITDLASIGLDTGFGNLGAVVDNSSGLDFTLAWKVEANTGSGWQAINSVPQHASHNGYTRTSFATGFYYTEAAVPEPTTLAVWSLLGLSTGIVVYRRRAKS